MRGIFKGLPLTLVIITLISLAFLYLAADGSTRVRRVLFGVAPGVTLDGRDMGYWLKDEVKEYVEAEAANIRVEPQNAILDRSTGEVVPEVQGRIVHVESTVFAVMEAERGASVSLKVMAIDPEITQKLLERITEPLGSFFTYIGGGNGGRRENIRIAAQSLDNDLLAPGQVFSFNGAVGPTTAERGYKPAPIIVRGRMVLGLGGGICQVSTTLFNAVDEAGLQVVERHLHSKPIGYVPPGRDATVSHHLDFKFRNNTQKYLLIRAWTDHRINITIMTH